MDKKRGRGRPRKDWRRMFKVVVLLDEMEAARFQALCLAEGVSSSAMGRKLFNVAAELAFQEGK